MLVPIIIICVLWAIALLILSYAHHPQKANIWYGLFLVTLSLGYFVALIKDFMVPQTTTWQQAQTLEQWGRFLSAFGNRACPYLFLQAAIRFSGFFPPNTRKELNGLLLIPFLGSFLFDLLWPRYGFLQVYIPHSPFFWLTTCWASAYGLLAHFLFFYAWYNEKIKQQRKHNLMVFLLNLPTLGIMIISYYGTYLEHMWVYNLWPVVLIFLLFFWFINLQNGVFGIRLAFQNTMEFASYGTNIINHVIKNDLQVIMNGVQLIKTSQPVNERTARYADIVLDSVHHLSDMTSKIREQTRDIELTLQEHDIVQLLIQAVDSVRLNIERRNITVIRNFTAEPIWVRCDAPYLKEVFNNLIINAVEAIDKPNGTISVDVSRHKRYVLIRIRDNGCGIPPHNLKQIAQPFFTTKKTLINFGLGLSFAYQVIEKHGGSIRIESEEGKGTQLWINLPV